MNGLGAKIGGFGYFSFLAGPTDRPCTTAGRLAMGLGQATGAHTGAGGQSADGEAIEAGVAGVTKYFDPRNKLTPTGSDNLQMNSWPETVTQRLVPLSLS